jgi:5-methylcytosine-specific restriction protein A
MDDTGVMSGARAALRPCRSPGCPELVRMGGEGRGYCDKHRPPEPPRGADAAWRRLYSTKWWRIESKAQLMREPWCAECARQGRPRVRATQVDHIVPHRGDTILFRSRSNLQSLCAVCHGAKTAREVTTRNDHQPNANV